MTTFNIEDAARRFFCYFEIGVLAYYRQEAHCYEVVTDDFEGSVGIRADFFDSLTESQREKYSIEIRFGYRALADGTLTIASFAPDIFNKTSEFHRRKWEPFQISSDSFTSHVDERFSSWIQRYLAGNWYIENGPIHKLKLILGELNSLVMEGVGKPLFKTANSTDLLFPAAENVAAYNNAHSAVYGLIIDGLEKETLEALAKKLKVPGKFDSKRTLDALKRIVSDSSLHSAIFDPLKVVSDKRRLSDHGPRSVPKPFPAFENFSNDLKTVVQGLSVLIEYLSEKLDLDIHRCVQRQQRLNMLPKLDRSRRTEAHYSIVSAVEMVGKTVDRVEYGFRKSIPSVHDSEILILHFTDGSVVSIDIGSNIGNLSKQVDKLNPEDLHCDLVLHVVPPPKAKQSSEKQKK